MKFGFQSSRFDNLNLEQELLFAENNKVDFFDIYFDDYSANDILNVHLPEIFTVKLPRGFCKLLPEDQMPYFDFINKNKPKAVTIQSGELTLDSLEYICSQINEGIVCIENSLPDKNEYSGKSYFDFMIEALNLVKSKGLKIYSAFDSGHAKICGYDPVSYAKELIESGIEIRVVHLHDNDGVNDQHRPAGSVCNGIKFEELISIFQNAEKDIFGVIEHWNNNYNALEYLRNLQY